MTVKGMHPSNGIVKARVQGTEEHPSWVLTIPAVVAEHFDFATEPRWFRAEVTPEGILYRPVRGAEYRPVPLMEPPSRMPSDYPKRLPAM